MKGLGINFIKLDQYPLDLIPFDNDLLSLEMESAFKVATISVRYSLSDRNVKSGLLTTIITLASIVLYFEG